MVCAWDLFMAMAKLNLTGNLLNLKGREISSEGDNDSLGM